MMKKYFCALLCLMCAGASLAEGKWRQVPYRLIGQNEFANFVKNWDHRQIAVRCALIQTPAHYDAYFAPAATMGNTRRYAPEPATFDTDNILLVSRVVKAPMGKTVFKVERVQEKDGTLEFHYEFDEPASQASFMVKEALSVRIAKGDYGRVRFIENGKTVCEQDVATVVDPGSSSNR